jgi:hypothetical protein
LADITLHFSSSTDHSNHSPRKPLPLRRIAARLMLKKKLVGSLA